MTRFLPFAAIFAAAGRDGTRIDAPDWVTWIWTAALIGVLLWLPGGRWQR